MDVVYVSPLLNEMSVGLGKSVQHHEYLKSVFKVQCWSSRFIVHAPIRHVQVDPSPMLEDIGLVAPVAVPSDTIAMDEPEHILGSVIETTADDPQETSVASPPVSSVTHAEPVTFNLNFFVAGNIVLVDGSEGAIDPVLREMKYKLAHNVIRAIALTSEVQTQVISWPLFDHQYAPKDAATACNYVQSKLDTIVPDGAILILCGQTAEQYCLSQNLRPGDTGEINSRTYVVTFNLSQMLNSPKIKHECYQHLLPLFEHGN